MSAFRHRTDGRGNVAVFDPDAPADLLEAMILDEDARLKGRDPKVTPMFGCRPYTPQTTCQDIHRRSIPRDSRLYCPCCHETGCDHFRCLKRDPMTDPKPEPKPTKHKAGKRKGGRS